MALIDDVKNYLDMTWDLDASELSKIEGIISRGETTINHKVGAILVYETDGRAKELLLEYCRFAKDGVLFQFLGSYSPMIKDLIEENEGTYGY